MLIVGFWLTLSTIEFLAQIDEPFINPSKANVLFGIFFFFTAKATTESLEGTLRDKALKHYFTSPIDSSSLMYSRLLKVLFYNLLLFGLAMSIVLFVINIGNINIPIDNSFIIPLYLLMLLAPLAGFNLSVLSHVKKRVFKIINAFLSVQIVTFTWFVLHNDSVSSIQNHYIVLMLIGSTITLIVVTKTYYRESWAITSQGIEDSNHHSYKIKLPNFISSNIKLIAESEFTRRWRNKQIPASMGIVATMGIGLVFIYSLLGPYPEIGLEMDRYFYPSLIAMTLFISTVIHVLIPSLTLISRDGRRLWCLRTLPTYMQKILMGKAVSILLTAPIITLAIALPVPIILEYPLSFVLFSTISSWIFIFLMGGVGLWAAVKFPNFDESTRGAPDIITMYSTMMIIILLSVFFLALPIYLFMLDRVLGVLSIVFAADMAALFMISMIKRASYLLKKMELSF